MKRNLLFLAAVMICLAASSQNRRYVRGAAPRTQQNVRTNRSTTSAVRNTPGATRALDNSVRGVNAVNYSSTARKSQTRGGISAYDEKIEQKAKNKVWKQIEASGSKSFTSKVDAQQAVERNRANYVPTGNDESCSNCSGTGLQFFDNAYVECMACHGVGYHKEYTAEKKAAIRARREELKAESEARSKKMRQSMKDMQNQKIYSENADILRSMEAFPEHYYDDATRKRVQDNMKDLRKKSTPGSVKYNKLEDWLRNKVND